MNSKKSWFIAFLGVLLLFLATSAGCSKFTLGPDAYSLATALDRVFERRDPAQLGRATELIQEYLHDNRLSTAEAERLHKLVTKAQRDDWSGARDDLRQLLFDQTQW